MARGKKRKGGFQKKPKPKKKVINISYKYIFYLIMSIINFLDLI